MQPAEGKGKRMVRVVSKVAGTGPCAGRMDEEFYFTGGWLFAGKTMTSSSVIL